MPDDAKKLEWIKPGATIFVLYFGRPIEAEVMSVGRKWAKLSHRLPKLNIFDATLDGGHYSSNGCAYPSREAHEAERHLCHLRRLFERTLLDSRREFTEEQLDKAAEVLGLASWKLGPPSR